VQVFSLSRTLINMMYKLYYCPLQLEGEESSSSIKASFLLLCLLLLYNYNSRMVFFQNFASRTPWVLPFPVFSKRQIKKKHVFVRISSTSNRDTSYIMVLCSVSGKSGVH
jgi:hypothetical protein